MAGTALDLLAPVHRVTIDDYRRMHEIGLFDHQRVELVDGVVVEMSPIGISHERSVAWLNRTLVRQLDDALLVSPQNSIVLPELRSMPQPDIAIRTAAEMLGRSDDPVRLVVEVADSSLRYDRITKARLYARAGIADYWIVDVRGQAVEVHRDPHEGTWRCRTVHGPGEVLEPVALPGVAVELDGLLAFTAGDA